MKNSVLDNFKYVNFIRKSRYKYLMLFFGEQRQQGKVRGFKVSNLNEIDYV